MSTEEPTAQAGHLPEAEQNGNGVAGNGALTTIENRVHAVAPAGWVQGSAARPEILSAKPNPMELMHAVRRRWPLAVGLGLLVSTVAAGLVWFLVPVKYEAFSLLRVSAKPESVLERRSGAEAEFAVFKRTQIQVILSDFVLRRTVAETEIAKLPAVLEQNDDPVSWLKGQLVIEYPDDSEILRVAARTKVPGDAVKIVNKVVEKYLREYVQRERDIRIAHERKLQDTYDGFAAQNKADEEALHKLKLAYKTSSTEAAQVNKRVELERLGHLMGQRDRLDSKLTENAMQINLMEARKEHTDEFKRSDVAIDLELNHDPQIADANKALAMLSEALWEEQSKPRPKATRIKMLEQKRQHMDEIIEERKNELRPKLAEAQAEAATAGLATQMSLPLLRKERENLEGLLKAAEDSVKEQQKKVSDLEGFNANVEAKLEELKRRKKITGELASELDRLNVERLAPERITKLDDATLANSAGDAIRKYVAVVFAAVLGFGLVVVGVAFVEFQSRKVNSVHEVHHGLGIRVLGELPNVSGRTWRRMKGGQGPALLKALMAERIDGTRANLIHTTLIAPPRVVMVTSAEPHEGKTTTASQLAASLARSGRRTLLIDADIRNPGAHRVFEMPQEPGLCELLRGEAERDAVVQPTRTANLWLLPAGRCDLRSVQALSTSYLGTVIAAVCSQFDCVVIDSGPLLKVADSLVVGQYADAAILSVLRDTSKVPNVYEACQRLRSVGITVLGAVVNGVNDDVACHGVALLMAETHAA